MTQPTTTRRDVLRLGTSAAAYAAGAAIVTGGVALAGEANGAAAGVSPVLLALIANADRLGAHAASYGRDVYDPARDRLLAAEAHFPHVDVPGFRGATWTTDDTRRVENARMWTSKDRQLATADQRDEFAAMQRLVAAHDDRQARVDKAGDRAAYNRIHEEDDENGARTAEAIDAVANFPAATARDLHAKLAFMVKHDWGNGMDWLPELLADAERLTGGEA